MLSFITWNVRPEIIEGFHVRWYGLLFAGVFIVSYLILQKVFRKENIADKVLDGVLTTALLGGIIGARLGHCLFYQPDYYLAHPIDILKIWEGGLASHGATIGILLAFYIFAKKQKLDYIWILSRVAIVVPIASGMIRVGNLMNSEIYGHATSLPWGFYFPQSSEVLNHTELLEPRHPTQIYEALAYFVIFALLLWYYIRNQKKNNVKNEILIGILLTSVFVFRFFIEFVKNSQVDFENGMPINMGQILSIPFVLIGVFFLWKGLQKNYKPFKM